MSDEVSKGIVARFRTQTAQPVQAAAAARRDVVAAKPPPAPDDRPSLDELMSRGQPAPTVAANPSAADQYLTVMNNRHAIIDNVGGKTVIASWEPSQLDPTKEVLVYHLKDSFMLRYSNHTVPVDVPNRVGGFNTEMQDLGKWWLKHRGRRQYRSVVFHPGGPQVVNDCLNLWRCWGVEGTAGDWSLIYRHIVDVVAKGNAEHAEYIIRWIAWSIQNPDRQAEVALVLIGEKGAGKGTLAECLRRIFGVHAFKVSSSEEVVGRFNGHLQDCVLLIADEAFWGEKHKACAGRLQGMITEATLAIEPKGIGIFQIRNCLHIIMLAEPGWVIPAGRNERRYAAFDVSTQYRGDRSYFRALHQQIEGDGPAAMFHDLTQLDLDSWHPREVPESILKGAALQKQQSRSLPAEEQWYLGLLHDGRLPGALEKRPNTTYTTNLLADAQEKSPRLRYLTSEALRNFLTDEERIGIACDKHHDSKRNGWAFPPLAECRAAWVRIYGPVNWDTPAGDWGGSLPPVAVLDLIPAALPAPYRRF
ncbi:DUF5906 domain-containing protein [Bradyrhizobium ganzhouense]|uniref:primase-helicase family protein n=1 Tax=Bradyrhizobium ganzhouense TaxID=1179767 RepID=UPI003CF856C5